VWRRREGVLWNQKQPIILSIVWSAETTQMQGFENVNRGFGDLARCVSGLNLLWKARRAWKVLLIVLLLYSTSDSLSPILLSARCSPRSIVAQHTLTEKKWSMQIVRQQHNLASWFSINSNKCGRFLKWLLAQTENDSLDVRSAIMFLPHSSLVWLACDRNGDERQLDSCCLEACSTALRSTETTRDNGVLLLLFLSNGVLRYMYVRTTKLKHSYSKGVPSLRSKVSTSRSTFKHNNF
jgi:hypothetical protein